MLPHGFVKQKPIHISIDNSDGQQQTSTGLNTTHFKNGIIFQNSVEQGPTPAQVSLTKDKNMNLCLLPEETTDFGIFKIPKKVSPTPSHEYEDNSNVDLLQYCLKRDIVWVLVIAIGAHTCLESRSRLEKYTISET